MKELKLQVEKLADEELKRSMVKFPLFNSTHEAISVIREEFEETADELMYAESEINEIWHHVKKNNLKCQIQHIESLQIDATNMAAEAIQLAAMASKFLESFKDE